MSEQATIQVPAEIEQVFFVGGKSRVMRSLQNIAIEIAGTNIPVLIIGESGTGKQVLARLIHELSPHKTSVLLRIVCGTLTPGTIPAQLRLYDRKVPGVGSVIFDEIGDLDRECQRRLLHILPDGDNVSGKEVLAARVISTTSQSLEDEVRSGRFRNDLFHRLNGVCLRIPPLRERPEDVAPLAEFFLAKHAARFGRIAPTLSTAAMERLNEHSWSGNARELENVMMKMLALANNEDVALADLSAVPLAASTGDTRRYGHSLKAAARAASREAERELILKALAHTRWNRKRAAQELQISYKSLLYKLKQIGLPDSEGE